VVGKYLDAEELEFDKTLAAHPELCCHPLKLGCVSVLSSQAQRKQPKAICRPLLSVGRI